MMHQSEGIQNSRYFIPLLCIWVFMMVSMPGKASIGDFFKNIHLQIDTNTYTYPHDTVCTQQKPKLYFNYNNDKAECQVKMIPGQNTRNKLKKITLLPSGDYRIIDSIINVNNQFYRFKIRFTDITNSNHLKLTFRMYFQNDTQPLIEDLFLQPCTSTKVKISYTEKDLFIGEETRIRVTTNHLNNLNLSKIWKTKKGVDYRFSQANNKLYLHILPKTFGTKKLTIPLRTKKPHLTKEKELVYDYPQIRQTFEIKKGRLKFLALNKEEITLNKQTRKKGIEVRIDNHWRLKLNKTYRIENREKPGGALIAEIFTKNNLANNKVLCRLRVFNYHKKSDGYLYIKDNDKPKFITNFDVTPETTIDQIQVLRPGQDWNNNLTVHPGENIEIKIKGKGLHKASYHFESIKNVKADTSIRSGEIKKYSFKVPLTFSKKEISIFENGHPTAHSIKVKEYQKPRPFDFLYIDYGDGGKRVSGIRKPVFYDQTLKDIAFSFYNDQIDSEKQLYGKQYLKIKVRVTDKRGDLVEMRTIDDIVVCPGESSPRHQYYETQQCRQTDVNLNNHLNRKTHELEEWSKIELVISHETEHYDGDGDGDEKKLEIYLQRHFKFDIDVSFPTGLLINKEGQAGYGNFGGVSMAMIAQFSFYHPEKINEFRPYKFGAGFLAFNAFNFEANSGRDVGAVILGSVYPTSSDRRLSFPLYLGGGYFLEEGKWFYLLGPGIRVKL